MIDSTPATDFDSPANEAQTVIQQFITISPAAFANFSPEEKERYYNDLRRQVISIFNIFFYGHFGIRPKTLTNRD